MEPFYVHVCDTLKIKIDSKLQAALAAKNADKLKAFDEKTEDALKNLGETEYSDALIAKAHYLCGIGARDQAVSAYELAFEKTAPTGHKIDILFSIIRIGFFFQDDALIHKYIEQVKA